MKNPFKYGTIVEDDFFTDRKEELKIIHQSMDSENHLILISPRRYGKSSLVMKAVREIGRPYLSLNFQNVISVEDLSSKLLRELFRTYKWERIKHLMNHFRIIPTISTNPITNSMDVSFQPFVDSMVLLEDAMDLLEKVSRDNSRLIVIFDEFQDIMNIQKGLDKQLRSIMQQQQHLNYILLGSQESMMTEIFERKKSPFYHFGKLMYLKKIPYTDFYEYIKERLPQKDIDDTIEHILNFTQLHPYYTQQLASQVWELMTYQNQYKEVVQQAVQQIICEHDLDYERLWQNFNRTDRRILQELSLRKNPFQMRQLATSTTFSAIKRLMTAGYVVRNTEYEIEDPFFKEWIKRQ